MDTIKISNRDDVIAAVSKYNGALPFVWIQCKQADGLFSDILSLKSIAGMKAQVVVTADRLFAGSKNLESVPTIELAHVRNADYLFSGCTKLTTGPKLNLPSAISIRGLYQNCINLVTVNTITGPKIVDITKSFLGCEKLNKIDLALGNITIANETFKDCSALTEFVKLSLINVIDASGMYENTSIKSVPDLQLNEALNLDNLFYNCSNLTSVGIINAPKLKSIWNTFGYCTKLTNVGELQSSDLASDYSEENIRKFVFEGCRNRDRLTKSFLGINYKKFSLNNRKYRFLGSINFSIKRMEKFMELGKIIKKLTNFAQESEVSVGADDAEVGEIQNRLLLGEANAVNDAISRYSIYQSLKSNSAFQKNLKEKQPKIYAKLQKGGKMLEDKVGDMDKFIEKNEDSMRIKTEKEARQIQRGEQITDAIAGVMEEPLASIFKSIMGYYRDRKLDCMKIAAMKSDDTGVSLMDEAAASSPEAQKLIEDEGIEIDKDKIEELKNTPSPLLESQADAKDDFIDVESTTEETTEETKEEAEEIQNLPEKSQIELKEVDVTDEKSARELGENLAKMVHGDKFDQAIFDDVLKNHIKDHTDADGNVDWGAVGAHLRNTYRAAGHVNKNFSKMLKKFASKNLNDKKLRDSLKTDLDTIGVKTQADYDELDEDDKEALCNDHNLKLSELDYIVADMLK